MPLTTNKSLAGTKFDDMASSVKVSEGSAWILWSGADYKGSCLYVDEDKDDLRDKENTVPSYEWSMYGDMNDKVSSVQKVTKNSGLLFSSGLDFLYLPGNTTWINQKYESDEQWDKTQGISRRSLDPLVIT